jgi:hypothetical protein
MEYISVEHQKAISQRYRMAVILVFGFFVTVLIYLFIARFITPGEPVPGSENWMRPVIAGIIALGLVVVVLRRLLMSQTIIKQASHLGVDAVLGKLMIVTIMSLVAAELVAILGLLLYFLTGDYQYSWRLGVVGIFLVLYSFPRRGEWETAVVASAKAQSDSATAARQATGV